VAFSSYPGALEELTAAKLQALISELRPVSASKAGNTSRASTTSPAADPDLVLTLATGGTYEVTGCLIVLTAANAAGDFVYGWSWTGTMSVVLGGVGPHNSLASGSSVDGEFTYLPADSSSPSTTMPYGSSAAGVNIAVNTRVVVTTGGNLSLIWAQLGSNANNTTLAADSWITARRTA
jgi:hypothetical protein